MEGEYFEQSVEIQDPIVVVLEYNDLISNKTNLSDLIAKAYGNSNEALGVCLVANIPDYVRQRQRLLTLASVFAELPMELRESCEHAQSSYLFGWSHGKEIMNGKRDVSKGSYYNNPIIDDPQQDISYIQKYPEYGYPNVWPKDFPEFKEAFQQLGSLIADVGKLVAKHCDRYLSDTYSDIPDNFISGAIENSKTCKARLLHYFSVTEDQIEPKIMDSWCGLHIDHSLLTGLTSAMYIDESCAERKVINSADASLQESGLYIKSRNGELIKVNIPEDCLAFQIGEAAEVASRGLLVATPHLVKAANVGMISRNTFAVFLQPNVDHVLDNDETFDEFTKRQEVSGNSKTSQMTEKMEFVNTFDILLQDLKDDLKQFNLPANGFAWFEDMIKYNCVGGKMNRGLTVKSALSSIENRNLTPEESLRSQILGWCVELLQAFFLVSDDIMDSSITRRGQPCWYKNEHVGMVAINDAFILESCIYRLLKKYFRSESYYVDLLDLFHEVTYQTELGQLMDLITAPEGNVDLSKFSIDKHAYIVEFKTAYYSFYLPIALAINMAGIKDPNAFEQARDILIPLGEYFQVQDDYLDCYGSPEVIGKVGTDIEDNKCGWLIVQALSRANKTQRAILDANYGQKDSVKVAAVKAVYLELNIEKVYQEYEEASYTRISNLIEKLDENMLPKKMFYDFMNRIYKRSM